MAIVYYQDLFSEGVSVHAHVKIECHSKTHEIMTILSRSPLWDHCVSFAQHIGSVELTIAMPLGWTLECVHREAQKVRQALELRSKNDLLKEFEDLAVDYSNYGVKRRSTIKNLLDGWIDEPISGSTCAFDTIPCHSMVA